MQLFHDSQQILRVAGKPGKKQIFLVIVRNKTVVLLSKMDIVTACKMAAGLPLRRLIFLPPLPWSVIAFFLLATQCRIHICRWRRRATYKRSSFDSVQSPLFILHVLYFMNYRIVSGIYRSWNQFILYAEQWEENTATVNRWLWGFMIILSGILYFTLSLDLLQHTPPEQLFSCWTTPIKAVFIRIGIRDITLFS